MAAIATYDLGDRTRVGNHSASGVSAFKNSAGADADPDGTITLKIKDPAGTITTYTYGGSPALQKETTGRYYVDYDLVLGTSLSGTYTYRLAGTGTNVMAAEEGSFTVRDSGFD